MNILQGIGKDYHSFAICLLNDDDGQKLEAIKESNHYKVKPIVQGIFNEFLKGDHDCLYITACKNHKFYMLYS